MVEPYLPKTDLAEKAERINSFIQQLRAENKALAGRVESLEQEVAGYESKLKQAEIERAGLRTNLWALTDYFLGRCSREKFDSGLASQYLAKKEELPIPSGRTIEPRKRERIMLKDTLNMFRRNR